MTIFNKINLQLFATQVTGQPTLSAEMKTFYDMTLLDNAQANLVHDQFGQKKPIPKNGGKTIEFRKFAPLNKALTPLTEGVTPAGNSLSVSTITASVAQYGDYIKQSDVLELTALDNTILEATKLLGQQAGLTLDTITRNVLVSGTNVNYASKWSGGTEVPVTSRKDLDNTAVLKVDTVRQIVAKLKSLNAPKINGDYIAIIHPFVEYDLMSDKEWKDPKTYCDPKDLYEGEIGKIAGVRFVETSEAKIFGPGEIFGGYERLTVSKAISSSSTSVEVSEEAPATLSNISIPCYINGVKNEITAIVPGEGKTTLTVKTAITSLNVGAIVCGQNALPDGSAVFSTLFLAQGAYGVTEVTGGGLETIVKQKGSGGTEDPLDQRSSVGWKAIKTAEILNGDYIVRVESVSPRYSATAKSN